MKKLSALIAFTKITDAREITHVFKYPRESTRIANYFETYYTNLWTNLLFPREITFMIFNVFIFFCRDDIKLATLVEGNTKAPFSIATTPRCRGGRYSIPWIAPVYPWSLHYIAEWLARRHQVSFYESLIWLNLGLNPGLLDHWRTLYSLGQWPNWVMI